jgi:hypothetical protein
MGGGGAHIARTIANQNDAKWVKNVAIGLALDYAGDMLPRGDDKTAMIQFIGAGNLGHGRTTDVPSMYAGAGYGRLAMMPFTEPSNSWPQSFRGLIRTRGLC